MTCTTGRSSVASVILLDDTFTEGELQITVTDAVSARKFDGDSHRLSHCMKAVDFIVELPDCYLFIEFKDLRTPQPPNEPWTPILSAF